MLPKVLTIGPSQPVNSVSFLEVTYVCAWVVSLGLGLRFRCWWVVFQMLSMIGLRAGGGTLKLVCPSWLWGLVMAACSVGSR